MYKSNNCKLYRNMGKISRRCAFNECKLKVDTLIGIGLCVGCKKFFCGNHRIYESHKCPNLVDKCNELKQANTRILMNSKTESKIITKI